MPANDEFQLLQAVAYGPVAISIGVGHNNTQFQDYEGGLYLGPCGSTTYHAMLLVGYVPSYYILKNSYGEDWGDDGCLYLPRGNTCAILTRGGSYPDMGL
ncbi:ervatamin-C-like [Panicum miliaceum]|uniref:Ervatamin-C-like n=1 Tax=Panicum miliaceum TaxID=4540 RepID=A0A3L6Q5B6_PANMI|nr:ervatamin-C-like [Panicum miliaceum]